jgi:hypothetical protein
MVAFSMTKPKYTAEAQLYRDNSADGSGEWKRGSLVCMPGSRELSIVSASAVTAGIDAVETQIAAMMRER